MEHGRKTNKKNNNRQEMSTRAHTGDMSHQEARGTAPTPPSYAKVTLRTSNPQSKTKAPRHRRREEVKEHARARQQRSEQHQLGKGFIQMGDQGRDRAGINRLQMENKRLRGELKRLKREYTQERIKEEAKRGTEKEWIMQEMETMRERMELLETYTDDLITEYNIIVGQVDQLKMCLPQ